MLREYQKALFPINTLISPIGFGKANMIKHSTPTKYTAYLMVRLGPADVTVLPKVTSVRFSFSEDLDDGEVILCCNTSDSVFDALSYLMVFATENMHIDQRLVSAAYEVSYYVN